jgi:nicotinic acid mononucleotide adenylyltransferase
MSASASETWPLRKLVAQRAALDAAGDTRPRVVLLTTGALNPIHLGHIEQLERARATLQSRGLAVLAGFLSPSHDAYVRPKMASLLPPGSTLEMQFAPCLDRVHMVRIATSSSDWLDVSTWEAEQDSFVDFPEVTCACDEFLRRADILRRPEDRVMYVCGDDHYIKCGLRGGVRTARGTFTAVVVPRAGSSAITSTTHAIGVPADAAACADLSSTKLRAALNAGLDVMAFVPTGLADFFAGPGKSLYKSL